MQTFTVTLPNYGNFQQIFDMNEFTSMFPDSLITRTLDLTHESDVPIENKLVDPALLEVLAHILVNKEYPAVARQVATPTYPAVSDKNIKKGLDYLGIDLPEYVYDPRYEQVRTEYPHIGQDLFNSGDLDENYEELLQKAVTYEFAPFAQYVIMHTDQKVHQQDNTNFVLNELQYSIYSETVENIMLDLIDHLPMTPASIEQYLRDGAVRGYTRFVKTIVDKLNGTYQPIPYDIETIINRSIPGDPEHYSAYRNMIMYLGQFIQEAPGEDEYEDREPPEDKDLEIRGLYKAFQNITHGIPITEPDDIGSYSYGLLWAAILSGHDKTFTDLLNSIPKYLIPQVQGFLLGYVAHPLLVRSDQLDQVGRYLRANGDYTTPSDAVTILDQEGYSHLADIIRT